MKTLIPTIIISCFIFLLSVPSAHAQAPLLDTRIECVTRGAQQICTTTTVERVSSSSATPAATPTQSASPTATPTTQPSVTPKLTLTVTPTPLVGQKHDIVDTGIQENILIGLVALFLFSTFSYFLARSQA